MLTLQQKANIMYNNISREKCKLVCDKMGWTKDKRRNVVTINGEKWSWSFYKNTPECRQTYEDTVGFIGMDQFSENMVKYRVKNYNNHTISRISPSGLKAYNVALKSIKEAIPI